MKHSNEIVLQHPNGTRCHVIGTQHVSMTHGSRSSEVVNRLGGENLHSVVLEVDQARFKQLDFRLLHLIHHDTSSLMELSCNVSSEASLLSRLLPDALLWVQHQQNFNLIRNEGVPLLLGSLYGADFLQAALAAATAGGPGAGADIVLADQPQDTTLARFRALADALGLLKQQLADWMLGRAQAEAIAGLHATPSEYSLQQQHHHHQQQQQPIISISFHSSSTTTTDPDAPNSQAGLAALQQLQQVLAAAAQLAAGRMMHHLLQWCSMAFSSQPRWYGENVHPVFLLIGNPELQQRLAARGCQAVPEAAAAAGRLLEIAAAGRSNGVLSAGLPAAQDVQAIRAFVASLETIMWSTKDMTTISTSTTTSSSSPSNMSAMRITHSSGGGSSSSSSMSLLQDSVDSDLGPSAELMPLRPWWIQLSESFNRQLSRSFSTPTALSSALQHHQHANVTAAAAYEQAVMAERNAVLAKALWQQAEAAGAARTAAAQQERQQQGAGSISESRGWWTAGRNQQQLEEQQQQAAAVVAVVGYNHLPGIVQLWRQFQQQQQQQPGAATLLNAKPSSGCPPQQQQQQQQLGFSPLQVVATDVAASAMELAIAGAAGLAYLAALSRWMPTSAAAAVAGGMGAGGNYGVAFAGMEHSSSWSKFGGLRRLGLLLLPAAVALLPLQRDADQMHEAAGLLSKVAVVNDAMLDQQEEQLQVLQRRNQTEAVVSGVADASGGLLRLVRRAEAAAAAAAAAATTPAPDAMPAAAV